jgi:type VI secretion system protein ImpG
MDPRLLAAYSEELSYLRETAREFGEEHEAVARQLGPQFPDDPDPYVERLLEGVAFLAARVRLKLDDQFPEFTQQLLNAVQPNYTAPTPAIAVAAFEPNHGDPGLTAGAVVERGAEITASAPRQETACRFRTSQAVELWPVRLAKAEYLATRAAAAPYAARAGVRAEAGLRLVFEASGEAPLSSLGVEALPVFLAGSEAVPGELYRQTLGDAVAAVAGPEGAAGARIPPPEPWGFDEDCAVLPNDGRAFRGYRLLTEYFACPERFLFIRLTGLGRAFAGCDRTCEVVILFSRACPALVGAVSADQLRLYCTPAVNLFEMQLARTPVKATEHEFQVLPDRTRPLDFEVFGLLDVVAHDDRGKARPAAPLYAIGNLLYDRQALFYTTRRRLRRMSTKEQRLRGRQDYIGSETWISLSAPQDPGRVAQVRELAIRALVTNRELPDLLKLGGRGGELSAPEAPVAGVSFVRPPSRPRPPQGLSDAAWRVIAHLTPNYTAFAAGEPGQNAAALRDHLAIYGRSDEPGLRRQIDGVQAVSAAPSTRRLAGADRHAFVRGLTLRLRLDDAAFENGRMFLFAAVLDRFLSEFASVNSFVETRFESPDQGEFAHWPPRLGQRPTI